MAKKNSIEIGFIGDVAFTGIFSNAIIKNNEVFDESVKKVLNSNDFNVINLEGPLSDATYVKKGIKVTNPPNAGKTLIQNKCNIFNLANNHILDLGKKGLEDTLKISKGIKAQAFGLNRINEFGSKTLYIEKNNIKIALIGVLQFYKHYDENDEILFTNVNEELIKEEIVKAKSRSDYVILNYHGFEEYTFLPIPYKRTLLKKYIEFGADIIIAHHPHVVQGYEKVENKLIFYSLGNFIFDIPQHKSRKGTECSIILKINFTKHQIKFKPYFINIDKKRFKVIVVKKNLAHENFKEIICNKYEQKWMQECHRLLFVDSERFLKSNMENDNIFIKKLKYFNRLFRLIKSYYKGKEAYRPILKSALRYKLGKIFFVFK